MTEFCCSRCLISFFFLLVFCAIVLLHSADLFWIKSKINFILDKINESDEVSADEQ